MINSRVIQPEDVAEKPTRHFILKEKIYDMMKYGDKAIAHFPWRDKKLHDEISESMLTMFRLAITIEKSYETKSTLKKLDTELEILRHLIRKAQDKDFYDEKVPKRGKDRRILKDKDGKTVYVATQPPLPPKKYEVWAKQLSEIGRIIGGLMKSV